MSRPFGVALLLAGIDETGPHLFHSDPSGTFTEWTAKAIGAGDQGAQTMLQEQWSRGITLQEVKSLLFPVFALLFFTSIVCYFTFYLIGPLVRESHCSFFSS